MAVWQFKILLIPREWAKESNYNCELLYQEESYDTQIAWRSYSTSINIEETISKYLSKSIPWDKEQVCWGDEESSDIQLWYEKDKIAELLVRVDLNKTLEKIIEKILNLAKDLDCLLFIPEAKKILELNESTLFTYASQSNAAKFVKNPRKYLENLKNDKNTI